MLYLWATLLALTTNPAYAMVNGTEVAADDPLARSTVLITMGANRCTGSLLQARVVLTAAHCLGSPAGAYRVYFLPAPGSPEGTAAPSRRGAAILKHPDYTRHDPRADDIGLLLLEADAPAGAAFVALPAVNVPPGPDGRLLSLGFGLQNVEGIPLPWEPVQLKFKELRATEPRESVPDYDFSYHRFYVDEPAGSLCGGDSGGPVYQTRTDGGRELVGVNGALVYRPGRSPCASPALITKVDTALPWLRQVLARGMDF